MLEHTQTYALDPSLGLGHEPGGYLVLLRACDGHPFRWLAIEPGDEVSFGRERAGRPGVIDALDDIECDSTLSRRHAVLWFEDGQARVRDLGSTNGTWLNSRRVPAQVPMPLEHGDLLRLGARSFLWLEGNAWGERMRGAAGPEWRERTWADFEAYGQRVLARAQVEGGNFALVVVSEGDPVPDGAPWPAWECLLSVDDMAMKLASGAWAVLLAGVDAREARMWCELVRAVAQVVPRSDGRRRRVRVSVGVVVGTGQGGLRLPVSGEALSAGVCGVRRLVDLAQGECEWDRAQASDAD